MEKEMVRIIDQKGIEKTVELISIIEDKDENNKYLVYSKDEKQKNGNLIIYVSKAVVRENSYVLANIESDEEWRNIKSILSEIVSR